MSEQRKEAPFPLQLQQVLFTKMFVEAMPGHQPPVDGFSDRSPVSNITVENMDGDPSKYVVSMQTSFNKEASVSAPYVVDVACLGVFTVDASLAGDEAKRAVAITGHNVLYGAIREAVSWLTGRQPYGPLVLGLSVFKPPAAVSDSQ